MLYNLYIINLYNNKDFKVKNGLVVAGANVTIVSGLCSVFVVSLV